jgi:hypothetical protein
MFQHMGEINMAKSEVWKSEEGSYNLKQMLLLIWMEFLSGISIPKCPNLVLYGLFSVNNRLLLLW